MNSPTFPSVDIVSQIFTMSVLSHVTTFSVSLEIDVEITIGKKTVTEISTVSASIFLDG